MDSVQEDNNLHWNKNKRNTRNEGLTKRRCDAKWRCKVRCGAEGRERARAGCQHASGACGPERISVAYGNIPAPGLKRLVP